MATYMVMTELGERHARPAHKYYVSGVESEKEAIAKLFSLVAQGRELPKSPLGRNSIPDYTCAVRE